MISVRPFALSQSLTFPWPRTFRDHWVLSRFTVSPTETAGKVSREPLEPLPPLMALGVDDQEIISVCLASPLDPREVGLLAAFLAAGPGPAGEGLSLAGK
jgi:hypothetical protein